MIYFHGDVVLKRVNGLPSNVKKVAKEERGIVLAEGEVTGHYHAIKDSNAEMYEVNGVMYLKTYTPEKVYHQEHKDKFLNILTAEPELLPADTYEVMFPQEFDHVANEARKVCD